MKIKFVSDVHLENSFSLPPSYSGEDIFIIAGDLAPSHLRYEALNYIESYLNNGGLRVLYVLGNHEYYGSSIEEVNDFWEKQCNPRLTVCGEKAKSVTIGDYTIIGSTLWCNLLGVNDWLTTKIFDFAAIESFSKEKETNLHHIAIETIQQQIDQSPGKCIVISHHSPATLKLKKYLDDFFYNNLSPFLEKNNDKIRWWFHGHTHLEEKAIIEEVNVLSFKNEDIREFSIV